jgi:hypothetical protein
MTSSFLLPLHLDYLNKEPGSRLAFIPVLLSGGNRGAPQLGQPGQVPHELSTQAMAYEYDQLNRLTQAAAFDQFADNAWQATNSIPNKYRNEFSYDANGNIATQSQVQRSGKLNRQFGVFLRIGKR